VLLRSECVRVEEIFINEDFEIAIDGEVLSRGEAESLAWRDGFRPEGSTAENPAGALGEMKAFWIGRLPFHGHIVHWRGREAK
jgi:hypothetical protein